MCCEFFNDVMGNKTTNATFVYLILKKNKALRVGDFRPIRLIISLYKIIVVVISLRLRDVLEFTF